MKDFATRTVWISGATSGIGKALAFCLMKEGATVIGISQDNQGLKDTGNQFQELPGSFVPLLLDLEKWEQVPEIITPVLEKYPRVDLLANIAGISQRALTHETPMWIDKKIMDINYFGSVALTKAVLPVMQKQSEGHILATSSLTGKFGFPLRSAYCAAKHALHGFFETLYLENKKNGIDVTIVIPGRVQTEISLHALDNQGQKHGKMDKGQAGGISPEKAAKTILKAVRKRKRVVRAGGKELLMLGIRKYFPRLFFSIAGKIKPA